MDVCVRTLARSVSATRSSVGGQFSVPYVTLFCFPSSVFPTGSSFLVSCFSPFFFFFFFNPLAPSFFVMATVQKCRWTAPEHWSHCTSNDKKYAVLARCTIVSLFPCFCFSWMRWECWNRRSCLHLTIAVNWILGREHASIRFLHVACLCVCVCKCACSWHFFPLIAAGHFFFFHLESAEREGWRKRSR